MGLGGVAIAVSPYVIHPKTAVLGRAGGVGRLACTGTLSLYWSVYRWSGDIDKVYLRSN